MNYQGEKNHFYLVYLLKKKCISVTVKMTETISCALTVGYFS
jgi:hypothetical protein